MLKLVLPETRITIARARREAMGGEDQAALIRLEQALPGASGRPVDQAAILLAKAELLYLAGRYAASHDVFENELEPLIPQLPHSVALVAGFNRSEVSIARFDSRGVSRHYGLVDEEHVMGVKHWDDSAVLNAISSAARGRSYESLPAIWRELLRTYRQGRWGLFRHASRYMADECLRIGLPDEAAFHAVVAIDSETAKRIGALLRESRDAGKVEAVVTRLLATANLPKHFVVACELLQVVSDLVPDALVDRVLCWALQRCDIAGEPRDLNSIETTAWKTIESLAGRASRETAQQIVRVAQAHRVWTAVAGGPNQFIRVREEIIDAVNQTVAALPVEMMPDLADATIPLAIERGNFKDFNNVVALLSHIAHRSVGARADETMAKRVPSPDNCPLRFPKSPLEIVVGLAWGDCFAVRLAKQRLAVGSVFHPLSETLPKGWANGYAARGRFGFVTLSLAQRDETVSQVDVGRKRSHDLRATGTGISGKCQHRQNPRADRPGLDRLQQFRNLGGPQVQAIPNVIRAVAGRDSALRVVPRHERQSFLNLGVIEFGAGEFFFQAKLSPGPIPGRTKADDFLFDCGW
jgi:hypothetical protein